jgi:hypothetical protein
MLGAGLTITAVAAVSGASHSVVRSLPISRAVTVGHKKTKAPTALPTRSLYLVGDASPKFPAGKAGRVAVIAQAAVVAPVPSGGETIPIAVRNNTSKPVTEIQAQGIVRNSGGKVVATGSDQGFDPTYLKPGQVALGYIYLSIGANVPTGSTMTVKASATTAPSTDTYQADLLVNDLSNTGQQIVGVAKNPRHHSIQGPYSVNVYCLSASGGLSSETGGFSDASNNLAAGTTSGFTVDLYGASCPQYLVGASGFDMAALYK